MFASEVHPQRCRLYRVMRTDLQTYDRVVLTYAPTDYATAVHRASDYQRWFDPDYRRYDYRVCSAS